MSAQPALSTTANHSNDSETTVNFSKAHFAYCQLETWLRADSTLELPAHEVEEETNRRGREVLRLILEAHFRARGSGAVGPALQRLDPGPAAAADTPASAPPPATPPTAPLPLTHKRLHPRTLKTIVGPVRIERTGYGAAGQSSVHPLDAQAALPALSFSYPLQQRLTRGAVQGPYDEVIDNLEAQTGMRLSKRSAEKVIQEAAVDFAAFYDRPLPPADATGPLVVVGVDGKGVPMVKPEKTLRKLRLGKGQKRNKKRMATVATVQTQEPWVRTPEAVLASLFDDQPAPKPLRVRREEHKRVWASLIEDQKQVITAAAQEMKRCDPQGSKRHVAVCDGERGLQCKLAKLLPGVVGSILIILDFIHVLERLWRLAYLFYPEGSDEAKAWVRKQALRILQGKVSQVIKGVRHSAHQRGLSRAKRQAMDKLLAYYRRNRGRMRYDVYLSEGLPIASGAVEGACKNLVKDRMERSGMRWTLDGAEAMLKMRALDRSGDFDDYWDFHREREQQRLHPQGQWQVVEK